MRKLVPVLFVIFLGLLLLNWLLFFSWFSEKSKAQNKSFHSFTNSMATNLSKEKCIPRDEISVLTWNVWFGSLKQIERGNSIIETILELSPTIACFQEVTRTFLSQLISNESIKNQYNFSDSTGETLGSYGVLMIWKKDVLVLSQNLTPLPTKMNRKLLLIQTSFDCETPVSNHKLK